VRKKVYIAGPISKGDLATNINRATTAFVALAKAGYAPLCPQWSVYTNRATTAEDGTVHCQASVFGNDGLSHADWLAVDLPWVCAADALLRLEGESVGADVEVRCALDHNVPVFYSVEEVLRGLPI